MLYEELIILPCHSIWTPGTTLGESRQEWKLAPFQLQGQDHLCFKEHILTSIDKLENNEAAILVLSGGQTKRDSGPISESYSYFQLARQLLIGKEHLLERIVLEEFARDSFENVLFLICRFFEFCGIHPKRMTIVGFEFKRERFVTFHSSKALQFPEENMHYIGNSPNPVGLTEQERTKYYEDLKRSEYDHALKHFQNDLYGIRGPLSLKKCQRNPFNRFHGYATSNSALGDFLNAIDDRACELSDSEIMKLLRFPWIQESC